MARSSKTIPLAAVLSDHDLSISDEDWLCIERAYGHPLPPDLRKKILDRTINYLTFEAHERSAAPATEAIGQIQELDRAAAMLDLAIAADATIFVEKHFHDARLQERRLQQLRGVLSSLRTACSLAQAELNQSSGWQEGEAWGLWIRQLTKILRVFDLPTAASKRVKNYAGTTSDFVMLVRALQDHLPPEARRHAHSPEALATAIGRAR